MPSASTATGGRAIGTTGPAVGYGSGVAGTSTNAPKEKLHWPLPAELFSFHSCGVAKWGRRASLMLSVGEPASGAIQLLVDAPNVVVKRP